MNPDRQSDLLFRGACVQLDVHLRDIDANLAQAQDGIAAAVAQGAELCVLPEMWTTSFVNGPDDELLAASRRAEERIAAQSADLGIMVIGSAPHAEDGRIYNRAQIFDRGEVLGEYRKIHLFSPNSEHRYHEPGNAPLVVDTRLGRIGLAICYDIRFPELIRYYFYAGAELLVVPAQWPEARAVHWRSLLKARAIENEMYVIGCNRTGVEPSLKNPDEQQLFPGDSRIIDPMGTVLLAGEGAQAPLLAEIEPRKVRVMRRALPIAKDRRPEVYARLWQQGF